MHLIQFSLQVFHLFLDGAFTVYLLVVCFLRTLGLIVYTGHFQILVYQLLQHFVPLRQRILCQNGIPLLVGINDPRTHGGGYLSQARPLSDICPCCRCPLEVLRVF